MISKAQVTLKGGEPVRSRSTKTDASGRSVLRNWPPVNTSLWSR
jgi:hypothetical protein